MKRSFNKPVSILLSIAALALVGASSPDVGSACIDPRVEISEVLRSPGDCPNVYPHRTGTCPKTYLPPAIRLLRSCALHVDVAPFPFACPAVAQGRKETACNEMLERNTATREGSTDTSVRLDIDDPASTAVVVNKQRPLAPVSYVPGDLVGVDGQLLREAAASSFALLKEAAASEGVELAAVSGYRSYESQAQLYAGYSARYGQAAADTISARPGHSEHQTGLAVDIAAPDGTCSLQACFEETAAGSWAAENAHRFGFIVRYPEDASSITGYAYEPWHLRFVGADLALSMHEHPSGTLEEHLGLPSAEHY